MRFDQWQNSLGQNYTTPIQVVSKTFSDTTATSSTQTYVTLTNGSLSITPKMSNSKFLVLVTLNGYGNTLAGSGMNAGISRTVSATTTRLIGVDGGNGDSWMGTGHGSIADITFNFKKEYLDSPGVSAGTPITYNALIGKWGGGTVTVNYSGYNGVSTITVMEIAQ